jgi:hypothetical protein
MSWARLMLRETRANPELDALIEKARHHVMTPEEMAAQRKSWVIGEMMLEHESMTRLEAEEIYDNILKSMGY